MGFLRRLFGRSEPDPFAIDPADLRAPGWDAIDAACDRLYPGVEPHHWGTVVSWALGGPDPLDGISAYAVEGPIPHWHFVTYGLSELYRKESPDTARSGWGVELTFRLRRPPGSASHDAPEWVFGFLQNLARHVVTTGNVLWPGHYLDLFGPIALEHDTAIRAATFVEDPRLGAIDTPHGRLTFVQAVGITLDEHAAIRAWDAVKLQALLARDDPLLVTDLARPSLLDDPAAAAAVAAGRAADGSSMGGVYVDQVATLEPAEGGLEIRLGAVAIEDVGIALRGRLPFGRTFFLRSGDASLVLAPADAPGWHAHEGGELALDLPPAAVAALEATLRPVAGTYAVEELPGVRWIVEPTIVRDRDDREIDRIG